MGDKQMKQLASISLCVLMFIALMGFGVNDLHQAVTYNSNEKIQDEDDPLPNGKWTVAFLPDPQQYNDSSVPVEITRTTTVGGKGKDNGLEEVIIRNRTSKNVIAVKLRYFITTEENRTVSLYQGPVLDMAYKNIDSKKKDQLKIPPYRRRGFTVKDAKIGKVLKPLIKNGTLNGGFIIRLRINEVIFEDGSIWKEKITNITHHRA